MRRLCPIPTHGEDIEIGLELSENDPEMVESVEQLVSEIEKKLKTFQLDMILNDPLDSNNAYLSIHPGAGGTESHDWAQMLLRMYLRWAEKNGYQTEIIEYQPGEEAGVKSVTWKSETRARCAPACKNIAL